MTYESGVEFKRKFNSCFFGGKARKIFLNSRGPGLGGDFFYPITDSLETSELDAVISPLLSSTFNSLPRHCNRALDYSKVNSINFKPIQKIPSVKTFFLE